MGYHEEIVYSIDFEATLPDFTAIHGTFTVVADSNYHAEDKAAEHLEDVYGTQVEIDELIATPSRVR